MSGFMSGFGAGFSEAFGTGYRVEKQRQENTFEKMLEAFENNRDYITKAKAADQKAIVQTKNIMEANGLDKDAFMEVYRRVKIDPASTEEWAKRVKITPTGSVKTAPGPAPSVDINSVFNETEQKQAPSPEPVVDAYAPAPSPIGGKVGEFINKGNNRVYEAQIIRMMQSTGRSREDVIKILNNSIEVPFESDEAKQEATNFANNTGFEVSQANSGNLAYSEKELSVIDSIAKEKAEVFYKLNEAKGFAKGMFRDAQDMDTLVTKSNGAVLADQTAGLAGVVDNIRVNIDAAAGLVLGDGNDVAAQKSAEVRKELNNTGDISSAILKQEQLISQQNGLLQRVSSLAQDRTLLLMKQQLLAYKIAQAEGQDGRNLAETERKIFVAMSTGGNDPEKFRQNISNLLFSQVKSIDDVYTQQAIENDPRVRVFETATGKKFPQVFDTTSVTNLILNDPELGPFAKRMQKYNTVANSPVAPSSEPSSSTAEDKIIGYTTNGKAVYMGADGNQYVDE